MEQEEIDKKPEYKSFTDKELVKLIAIVFVLGVYFFIFLKIMFLK